MYKIISTRYGKNKVSFSLKIIKNEHHQENYNSC
nr:MAG TPA: hypothetical protein [Caudoviricetes sp.]